MSEAKHNSVPEETGEKAESWHGNKHKKSCGTWLWSWGFPISLNLVPNCNCISLGSRATNYL